MRRDDDSERIGTWDEALRAANLSPAEKPNASSERHPGYPVTCPRCGTDAKADPEARKQECSACGHVYQIDHARIAFFGGSDSVTALANGPIASSDRSTRPERHPGVVDRLKAPDRVTQQAKARPETTIIYYLVGDERRAVDRFIEVNEAYVRDCLEDTPNPLQHNWSEELYHLLLEQWHWNGYAKIEDSS